MRNWVLKIWRGEAKYTKWLFTPPLYLLSLIYKLCMVLRKRMYDMDIMKTKEAPIPVISVGNITLGGTGKTPVVERLSKRLKEAGFNPGIATRGYKRKRGGTFIVDIEADNAEDVGDEAFMLATKTQIPVLVGADRTEAIKQGVSAFQIDVALLDDGFQSRSIKKDMEILVINNMGGKESDALFPLGPYREPATRIKDAHAILLNKGDMDDNIRRYGKGIPAFHIRYKPLYLYNMRRNLIGHHNFLKDMNALAFSGLGNNRSFFNLLREMGAKMVHEIAYPDHYAYKQGDIEKLLSFKDVEIMVTTEKDAVKLAHMDLPEHLFYLAIEVVIDREDELVELMQKRILTFSSRPST